MKKRAIFLIVLFLALGFQQSVSAEVKTKNKSVNLQSIQKGKYPLVNDSRLIKALDILIGTDGEWARRSIAGYNASKQPIKVIFKNLSSISPEFKDFDALGWKDEKKNLLIFISDKHKNTPVEAIGALLSHESIHQDRDNSIREETYGWTYEAEVWMQLKEKYPSLKTIPPGKYSLVDRENLMEMLFRKANFSSKLIEEKVRSNYSYKSLPETSVGFGK